MSCLIQPSCTYICKFELFLSMICLFCFVCKPIVLMCFILIIRTVYKFTRKGRKKCYSIYSHFNLISANLGGGHLGYMVKLIYPRSTSRDLWHSLGIELQSPFPVAGLTSHIDHIRPRTHKFSCFYLPLRF